MTAKKKPSRRRTAKPAAPPRICPHCGKDFYAKPASPELTGRRLEVLKRIARGMSRSDIATELGISPRTVEFHRMVAMKTLQLDSTAGIVHYAIQHGLI